MDTIATGFLSGIGFGIGLAFAYFIACYVAEKLLREEGD
jgi:hypothetical protein